MIRFAWKSMLALAVVGLVTLTLGPAVIEAESDCTATVQVSLAHEDHGDDVKHYQFEASISTSEDCAQIEWDLVIEELMPSGQTKKVRIPRRVKLDDGSLDEMVRYNMPASFEMLSYEGKIVECLKCGIMP
jgi:hypothetical protein